MTTTNTTPNYSYQLLTNLDSTTSLVRTNADGSQTWIPQDPKNADYAAYLASGITATVVPINQAELDAIQAQATKVANAKAAIVAALPDLATAQAQAQTDLATLAASNSPNAPILTRLITNTLTLAQAVDNILTAIQILEP